MRNAYSFFIVIHVSPGNIIRSSEMVLTSTPEDEVFIEENLKYDYLSNPNNLFLELLSLIFHYKGDLVFLV